MNIIVDRIGNLDLASMVVDYLSIYDLLTSGWDIEPIAKQRVSKQLVLKGNRVVRKQLKRRRKDPNNFFQCDLLMAHIFLDKDNAGIDLSNDVIYPLEVRYILFRYGINWYTMEKCIKHEFDVHGDVLFQLLTNIPDLQFKQFELGYYLQIYCIRYDKKNIVEQLLRHSTFDSNNATQIAIYFDNQAMAVFLIKKFGASSRIIHESICYIVENSIMELVPKEMLPKMIPLYHANFGSCKILEIISNKHPDGCDRCCRRRRTVPS